MHLLRALTMLAALVVAGTAQAVTLGIVVGDRGSEVAARALGAAQSAADDKGWATDVRDAGGKADQAAAALKALQGRKVDGVLLVKVPLAQLGGALAPIAAAHLPVLAVESGHAPGVTFDVEINDYITGAQLGAWLLDQLPAGVSLAMLRDDADPRQRRMGRTLDVMLEDRADLKVRRVDVAAGAAGADEAKLSTAMSPPPAAVWTGSDALGLAAEKALAAAGAPPGVLLTSVGGGQPMLDRLRDEQGRVTAAVAVPYELMGEAAVDALDDLIAGTPAEQVGTAHTLYIDPVLVDRTNVPPAGEWPW